MTILWPDWSLGQRLGHGTRHVRSTPEPVRRCQGVRLPRLRPARQRITPARVPCRSGEIDASMSPGASSQGSWPEPGPRLRSSTERASPPIIRVRHSQGIIAAARIPQDVESARTAAVDPTEKFGRSAHWQLDCTSMTAAGRKQTGLPGSRHMEANVAKSPADPLFRSQRRRSTVRRMVSGHLGKGSGWRCASAMPTSSIFERFHG